MRFLSNADVAAVLDMEGCLQALRAGYADLDRGDATFVPRIDIYAPTGRTEDYYRWGSMTGACRSMGVVACRIKSDVVSWPDGRTEEKYCIRPGLYSGIIVVYALADGEPLALIQDGFLQHMRVGACAGLGTEALSRPEASVLGLVGSGGMAETYLHAIAAVRRLSRVRVFSPNPEHRTAFAARQAERLGIEVTPVGSAREAVGGADIVATATDAMQPTFEADWVPAGAHLTCVTRREVDERLLDRADVVAQLGMETIPSGTPVPGLEWARGGMACFVAGQPEERARVPGGKGTDARVYPSLADIRQGRHPGRTGAEQVTMFLNVGTQGLQFAAVAGHVLRRAAERGMGAPVPDGWFTQDIRD